jgi:hypothetical protein
LKHVWEHGYKCKSRAIICCCLCGSPYSDEILPIFIAEIVEIKLKSRMGAYVTVEMDGAVSF